MTTPAIVSDRLLSADVGGVTLAVRVSPNAETTSFDGAYGADGFGLKLRIAAPPAEGKGSAEAPGYDSGLFDVGESDAGLIRMYSSCDRSVLVRSVPVRDVYTDGVSRVLLKETG